MSDYNRITWLHQILIVDNMKIPNFMPDAIQKNIDFAKEVYPNACHKMWGGEELREFIRKEFGMEVLIAFDTLTPYSYKCDLARFCLLWVYGGIYCDLAIRLLNPWNIPTRCGVAAFSEMYPGMESWTLTQTSLLWSMPKRKEWQYTIDAIVENCRDHFYGSHDHYPTAGALLGRCFARVMAEKGQTSEADDQFMGEVRYITPERRPQNVTYVAPEHKSIIGLRTKKVSGEISEFNIGGTNNYIEIWGEKKVYGERVRNWHIDDPKIVVEEKASKTLTGAVVKEGTSGRVLYGPFLSMDPGDFKLIIHFSPNTKFSRLFVDVTAGYGTEVISERLISENRVTVHDNVELLFSTKERKDNVEFRVSVFEDFIGEIRKISLIEKKITLDASDFRFSLKENVRKTNNKIIFDKECGIIFDSPFVSLERGQYKITFVFDKKPSVMDALVEVTYNLGDDILEKQEVKNNLFSDNKFMFEFSTPKNLVNVSLRLTAIGHSAGVIKSISIEEVWNDRVVLETNPEKKYYTSKQSQFLETRNLKRKINNALKFIKKIK